MTERGKQLARAMAMNLHLVREHDKSNPDEVNEILAALMSTIRSWKPQALRASLDTGPVAKIDPG